MKSQDVKKIIVYTLYDSKKYENFIDCFKEMDNLYHMVKNYIERNCYINISFIIGISNIDSKTAKVTYINTGKRGRPRKEIIGERVNYHIHLYVMCKDSSVSTFSNELRIYLQKKKHIQFMQKKNTLDIALPYVEKQCCHIRRYGDGFR